MINKMKSIKTRMALYGMALTAAATTGARADAAALFTDLETLVGTVSVAGWGLLGLILAAVIGYKIVRKFSGSAT